MIPVQVKEIAFDLTMTPVVILLDQAANRVLPIWVGPFEAQSIAIALQGIPSPRPMTHDLLKSLCEHLGVAVRRVVINDIKDGTYYAAMFLQTATGEVILDSRPSDAIALALRTGAEVFISDKLSDYTLALEDLIDAKQQEELQQVLGISSLEDYKKSLH